MRHVIVGVSAAGMIAIEAIRSRDAAAEIVAISAEGAPAYARIFLPDLIAGRVNEAQISLRPEGHLERLGARLLAGRRALHLDPNARRVELDDGTAVGYDELLIATGASPVMPAIPVAAHAGVWGLRSLADARAISAAADAARSAAIVGGGLVGLKAAEALAARGLQVTVIVSSGHVLSQILDRRAAGPVQAAMTDRGVRLVLDRGVAAIEGEGRMAAVVLDDGQRLACDLVIMAKGVAAETGCLAGTALTIAAAGVAVDEYGRTGVPHVWAAGDVAVSRDLISGKASPHAIWPEAVEQGRAAGLGMSGELTLRQQAMSRNVGSFFGVTVLAAGASASEPGRSPDLALRIDAAPGWYRKQVLRGHLLVGVLEVGGRPSGLWQTWIRREEAIPSPPGRRPTYGEPLASLPQVGAAVAG